jgi:hypothetical protein
MPRRHAAFPALASLIVSLGLATAYSHAAPLGYVEPRASRDIATSPWGIQAGSDERLDLLDRAGGIGVKWTRLLLNWNRIESQKGRYDFRDAEAMIEASLRAGVQPFLCVTGGNKLYSEAIPNPDPNWRLIYGVKPAPPILDETATRAWLAFVEAALEKFGDRVSHWEIWNEPNHYAYWGAKPNASDYGRLVRVTSEVIRQRLPSARIIAGSLAGIDAKFIAGFLAEDTARLVDIVSFHNYANLPEARIALADETWAALNAHKPGLELWQGECGYGSASSTKDFRGTSPWGEIAQAKWLLRQAFIDTFYMRASLSNYFKLFDGGDRSARQARPELRPVDRILGFPAEPTGRRVRGVGVNEKCLLSNPDLQPKPGYYAYRNLCAVIDGRYAPIPVAERPTVSVRTEGQFRGIAHDDAYPSVPLTAAYRRADGAVIVAYWLPWQPQEYTPRPATVDLTVRGRHYAEPVLINLLDGSVHAVSSRHSGTDTVFTGVPLLDFPLVLAERSSITLGSAPSAPIDEAVPRL